MKRKLESIPARPIVTCDDFHAIDVLRRSFPDLPCRDVLSGSVCTIENRHGEELKTAANRIVDLFFNRTELISRSLSGSYIIQKDDALQELHREYKNNEEDPMLQALSNFSWDDFPAIFRRIVNRARAPIAQVVQAQIPIHTADGCYYFFYNFVPKVQFMPSITQYSFCIYVRNSKISKSFDIFFATTCLHSQYNEETTLSWTDTMVKGLSRWLFMGKSADKNPPLREVPSIYYSIYNDVRRHPVVVALSANWEKYERTDKSKHLFEDVGIVAYLVTFWKVNMKEPVRFVDIGCGNGVNTFLLNSMYGDQIQGVGFDIKRRRIWDYYREQKIDSLREETIIPNFPHLSQPFPEGTNFLVGIHTDEMTPWIPLFAMKHRCNFFILPCCPFDFFGRFAKRGHAQENEWEYFSYLVSMIKKLGFIVKIDNLKIPSEKSTAIIGLIPDNGKLLCDKDEDWVSVVEKMMEPSFKANNSRGFAPRSAQIEVKNCTKLPLSVRDDINKALVRIIQAAGNPSEGVPLSEIVRQLSSEQAESLKSQNGGIQTFIRNHKGGYIIEKGRVSLRKDVFNTFRLPKTTNMMSADTAISEPSLHDGKH